MAEPAAQTTGARRVPSFSGLRRAREAAGMSLEAASERIGKTASHLSKIERGLVSLMAFDALNLAHIYGVTVEDLLTEEESK